MRQVNKPQPTRAEWHQRLLDKRGWFFTDVSQIVRRHVPSALAIWCYGPNAAGNHIRLDWDFIAVVPADTDQTTLDALNHLNAPLANLPEIERNRIDVQVIRASDGSLFAQLMRKEGFRIWTINDAPARPNPANLCLFSAQGSTYGTRAAAHG